MQCAIATRCADPVAIATPARSPALEYRERWALLVVASCSRSSVSDCGRALGEHELTDRLRELEAHGVLQRRTLPPPAASAVYELTERGRELEPILEALGAWGSTEPRSERSSLTATSVLIFLRRRARAHPNPPTHTFRVQLDNRVWTISSPDGKLEIEPRDTGTPDASLHANPETLNALLHEPAGLDAAIAAGSVHTDGNLSALRRLLHVAT